MQVSPPHAIPIIVPKAIPKPWREFDHTDGINHIASVESRVKVTAVFAETRIHWLGAVDSPRSVIVNPKVTIINKSHITITSIRIIRKYKRRLSFKIANK